MEPITSEFFTPHIQMLGRYRIYEGREDACLGPALAGKLEAAREAALAFTTRDEYLVWVAGWKMAYLDMTMDARAKRRSLKKDAVPYAARWYRNDRWAMLWLRAQGKVKAGRLRQERLAALV